MKPARLELKIPPAILMSMAAVLMLSVARSLPVFSVPAPLRYTVSGLLLCCGAFFIGAAVVSFRNSRTTVNPMKPDASTCLVTSGIFSRTRNPMYLGFLFILLAWAVFLSSLYSLILAAGCFFYLNQFQIKPEERALESLYGAEFLAYKKRVRRWL